LDDEEESYDKNGNVKINVDRLERHQWRSAREVVAMLKPQTPELMVPRVPLASASAASTEVTTRAHSSMEVEIQAHPLMELEHNGGHCWSCLKKRGIRRRRLTRRLLGNAHHDGLRVDIILQVSTRHRITNEQKARFT
jgi:hypothetical protein